jgi:endo-1,4-beta-mannosidase
LHHCYQLSAVYCSSAQIHQTHPDLMGVMDLMAPSLEPSVSCHLRSAATKTLYKQHISTLTSRVNSVNGKVYKEDPAIMGWDVLNEPR